MKKNILVSTTNSIEGYEIKKYFGICSERVVVGAGLFSEFFAGFTDVFGGRSSVFEARLKELYEMAMDKLIASASKIGANALVGTRMDIDEISGKSSQMFMISVSGTAVLIKSKIEPDMKHDNESDNILTGKTIENQVKTKDLTQRLKKCTVYSEFKNILSELMEKDIMVPLDLLLEMINDSNCEFTQYQLTEDIIRYLESYEKKSVSNHLNEQVMKAESFTNLFIGTYTAFAFPDYKLSVQLFDKLEPNTIETMLLPVLQKYKNNYDNEDISNIVELCTKMDNMIQADIVSVGKGLLNKDVWICSCGKKVAIDRKRCDCDRGRNGLLHKYEIELDKTSTFLKDVKEAFEFQFLQTFNAEIF